MAKIYLHLSEFYGNFPRKRVRGNSFVVLFIIIFTNILRYLYNTPIQLILAVLNEFLKSFVWGIIFKKLQV